MVLLDEEPQKLLASVQQNFQITSDTAALSRISSNLSHLRSQRSQAQADTRHLLRLLSRQSELAAQSYEATAAAAHERKHGEKMVALDREKFALAKSVNELESQHHSLEGELARLRVELESVEDEDVIKREVEREVDGGTLLKLKMFRSLGIDIQEDGKGGWGKAVIRMCFCRVWGGEALTRDRQSRARRYACRKHRGGQILAFLLCQLLLECPIRGIMCVWVVFIFWSRGRGGRAWCIKCLGMRQCMVVCTRMHLYTRKP